MGKLIEIPFFTSQQTRNGLNLFEKILGFKNGGPIGPSTGAGIKVPGATSNVSASISVNVNNEGSELDPIEITKQVSEQIRATLPGEIEKMQRPGGQLRRRQRR